jgi:hypothetical protein
LSIGRARESREINIYDNFQEVASLMEVQTHRHHCEIFIEVPAVKIMERATNISGVIKNRGFHKQNRVFRVPSPSQWRGLRHFEILIIPSPSSEYKLYLQVPYINEKNASMMVVVPTKVSV